MEELDSKHLEQPAQREDTREAGSANEGYKSGYRQANRPYRPRIQRPYNAERVGRNDTAGFRPEGFGAGLQGQDEDRSQRGGYQSRGGYQPRGGYNNNHRGGYGNNRGGYNNTYGNDYHSRPQGGYRPRYNNQDGEQEGYQPRNSYNAPRGGERRPYQQGGGYHPRYNNQEEGGYQPRGGYYNNSRGGYGYNNNRNGGAYGNARGGGYRQGGYRSQGHAFDPRGRYNNPKKRIDYVEESVDPNEPIRLNKFLANAGVCSRREADEFIQAGVVTVNGEVVTELGTKITRADEVKFHDQPVKIEKKVYILLNKPKDCMVTSDDPQERKTVMDLVKDACPERIYPVGRLDRNTTGVLLLTNDGELSSKLTHPKFLKKKVYHVHLDKALSLEDMRKIAEGIFLDDGEIKADDIQYVDERDKSQVGIEIHSGKNRIVRRIFESLGYRVTRLDRVLFAGLTKKGLRRGDWRFLTQKEVEMLRMGAFE
ncbi:MAG: pseudouridine synthase [Prevotella sp.]|nr:pseudouridine synthase [Prevotella sp.]